VTRHDERIEGRPNPMEPNGVAMLMMVVLDRGGIITLLYCKDFGDPT
jgi:hypothetical protein